MEELVRLQKFLADSGVCSRRAAEKLIEDGKVKVGGKTAFIGDKVPAACTTVTIDGRRIYPRKKDNSYFMLYKPRGYVTTAKDELSRKCVSDIVSRERVRLYPVGRLDKDSEGLLIMTNDGDLANKLAHPKNRIPKTYRAIVTGDVSADVLRKLTNGVYIEELDYTTSSADVVVHSVKDDRTILLITIYEGKNRQIRRMCEACDLEVLRLKREKIGKLSIGTLKSGQYRKLTEKEVTYLKNL
ncbi:MAG: rRNA pseudouridine synthase [Clostridia bacterium]|nr:rRNA pseudouridine synthase [Clostridia bacterium]